MKMPMPNTNAKPAVISAPEKKGSMATMPCCDTGKKPGSAVPGFSGSALKPGKV